MFKHRGPQELYCPSQGQSDPVADEWERQVLCLQLGFSAWVFGRDVFFFGGGMEGWRDGGMEDVFFFGGGMEGWRDGGMEGWRDGGMEGWRDGWMDGWMDIRYIPVDGSEILKASHRLDGAKTLVNSGIINYRPQLVQDF